jgi:hypothetical protein
MSFVNKFVNELDIALKTLSNKKPGTPREYPVTEFNPNLTDEEIRRHTSAIKDLLPESGRDIRLSIGLGF